MRKIVMYCDRCNKEFEKWDHRHKQLIGVADLKYEYPYLSPSQKDLCESCYTELENWWTTGLLPKSNSQEEDDEFPFK